MTVSQSHLSLEPGEVHVWLSRPESIQDEALLKRYANLLSDEESSRHQRFRFARHRLTFLVAHALVRTSLSRYASCEPQDWRFENNRYGRPSVTGNRESLKFNLSHTDGLVACAVTREMEVGVDVECYERHRIDVRVADRFFAAPEVRDLHGLAPDEQPMRFLQYWTLKESYIKARGMGLALPLGGFAFGLSEDRDPHIQFLDGIDDDPERWRFKLMHPVANFVLALAVERTTDEPVEPTLRETVPLL